MQMIHQMHAIADDAPWPTMLEGIAVRAAREGARATPRALRDVARESRPARSAYLFLVGAFALAFFLLELLFLLDFFLCLTASGLGFRRL
jgi:hypothetical protein